MKTKTRHGELKSHMHNMKKEKVEMENQVQWKNQQIYIYMDANLVIFDEWNLGAVYQNDKGKIKTLTTWNQRGHVYPVEGETQEISNVLGVAKNMNVKEVVVYTHSEMVVNQVNQRRKMKKVEDHTHLGRQTMHIAKTLYQLDQWHTIHINRVNNFQAHKMT